MEEINIIDKFERYSLDKVSCFERPIYNVIEYQCNNGGNLCMMMMKLFQTYRIQEDNPRSALLHYLKESLHFHVYSKGYLSINRIKKYIQKGLPVIIGINLKNIFYSSYYEKDNWPHWIIITGYDEEKKRFSILDNTQFSDLNSRYDRFYITYSLYKKASRSYISQYGQEYAHIVMEKGSNKINYRLETKKIFSIYKSIDKRNAEVTMYDFLIKEYKYNLRQEKEVNKIICEEIKKRLINISKYHFVFWEEAAIAMQNLGYSNQSIDELKCINFNLKKEMDNYILKMILNLYRKPYIDSKLPYAQKDETVLENILEEFYEFISRESSQFMLETIEMNFMPPDQVENNEDGIISYYNGKYKFDFKNGQYNWWINDNAPKVILFHGHLRKKYLLFKTKVFIKTDISQINFQAGIFIRDGENEDPWLKNGYFGAVDYQGKLVFDAIGNDNNEKDYNIQEENELFLEIEDSIIWFGIIKNEGNLERLFSKPFEQLGRIELGLACKTWGGGMKLHISYEAWEIGWE